MKKTNDIEKLTKVLSSIDLGDCILIGEKNIQFIKIIIDVLNYMIPTEVTEYTTILKASEDNITAFDICPKCNAILSRTYQTFCNNCGQHLKWISWKKMKAKKCFTKY